MDLATLKALWAKYGIWFIFVGIALAVVEFGNLAMDFLGWSSKKDLQAAQKTDTELKAKEAAINAQADTLVKEAAELPSTEKPIANDWYLNKK